jgi:TolA-binding protein
MNLRRNILFVVFGGVLCMPFASVLNAQDLTDVSASGLLYEASKNLSAGNYAAAVPYLTGYLERMEPIKENRVTALKQSVRLKLGKIFAYMEDPFTAADYLEQYTQGLPCYQPREAWKMLALTLYKSGQFEKCVEAAKTALSEPLPKDFPDQEKKSDYEELSQEQMAGFSARQMKRIEEEAREAEAEGDGISDTISEKAPDAEPEYTVEELVFLNITLAEAYSKLEKWEDSLEPYKYVIDNAIAGDRKGYAIMQLVNSLIALERFDQAKDFIVKLYRTNARYDIRVNMALMSAAGRLLQEGRYDSALLLYRMVLPRNDLVAYQVRKMNELRRESGLPRVEIQSSTNDMGRVETLFGSKSAEVSEAGSAFGTGLPPKPMELVQLEESVGVLLNLPPYEDDVLYRTGLLFARAGRPWEAISALEDIAASDPDSEKGQDAFVESLAVLADPLKKYEIVDERGWRFLNTYKTGAGPRRVAYTLTGSYQKQERWKDIKKLFPVIEQFVPSEDPAVVKFDCELYYMQAIADIVLMNYSAALAGFERVLTDYPDSHQQENATYWHAMAQLFMKNYQDALDEFDFYVATWPEGSHLPSATFHSGVTLFGMEKYDEAMARFTQVIETWPDSAVYSDACSMRADLLASQGSLDEAQRDYEEAIASAGSERQAAYAVFQMASMFDLEERYDEILKTVDAYLTRYGDEADVAKATYWIGKTKLAQGLTAEAVDAYCQTIVQFGGDVLQDGVDLIISELLTLYRRLDDEERNALQQSLRDSLQQTDTVTLKLRLRVLLAEMNGTAQELGVELNAELDDLTKAPPPVLAIICDSAFEVKDYSRAADILNLFQIRYEDSEFMKSALKLRAFELFDAQQYDEALQLAEETQSIYGMDIAVVWAQLLKGRIYLKQGDLDRARELFRTTLAVSQWRGAAFAEATYYLGKVEESAGSLRDAFAWYQRTYFQWKGVAGGYWAAEGYLASARCLEQLGLETDRLNTYRAMLFDKYVNTLPQAEVAREALGKQVVQQVNDFMAQGLQTNITVKLSAEDVQ